MKELINPDSINSKLFRIHDEIDETISPIDPNMNFSDGDYQQFQTVFRNLPPEEFDAVRVEIGPIEKRGYNHKDVIKQIVKHHSNQPINLPIPKTTDEGYFPSRRFARALAKVGVLFEFRLPDGTIPSREDIFIDEMPLAAD